MQWFITPMRHFNAASKTFRHIRVGGKEFRGKILNKKLSFPLRISSINVTKSEAWRPATLIKRVSNTGAFLWNLRNFWEHLFYRAPPVAVSVHLDYIILLKTDFNPLIPGVHWKVIHILTNLLQVCLSMFDLLVDTRH